MKADPALSDSADALRPSHASSLLFPLDIVLAIVVLVFLPNPLTLLSPSFFLFLQRGGLVGPRLSSLLSYFAVSVCVVVPYILFEVQSRFEDVLVTLQM